MTASKTSCFTILAVGLAIASPPCQASHRWKLRPELEARLAVTDPGDKIPVYFVMRDRLRHHELAPNLRQLHGPARRVRVVRDLRDHARKTQSALLKALETGRAHGTVSDVKSNWLGNFVQARIAKDAIDRIAALPDVWEIWYDAPRPLSEIEDSAPPPLTLAGDGPTAVGADKVWAMGITGRGVVVMNADSGINVDHNSLVNRLWWNNGEIENNGIDDDGNGFIDDHNGWNFFDNNNDLDDNGSHGTSTAGVLVADGACNGTIYGIAPGGEVMTGKIATEADQWSAIQYGLLMGAQVQTSSHSYKNSYLPPPNYQMHRDIGDITLLAGLIRFNSTSNNGNLCTWTTQSVGRPFNISVPGNLPAPYTDPAQTLGGRPSGVIGVGAYLVASGQLDPGSPCGPSAWNLPELLARVPNYPHPWNSLLHNDYPWNGGAQMGLLKPDVVAPTGTLTTVGPGRTCLIRPFGGTSNATPIAAGCAMLWKSANMSLTPEDVAMIIHQTSDDAGIVPGKENTWGAGRIDAFAGVHMALAVHRVDSHAAWKVPHKSGTKVTLEIDGSANRPAMIAVGLVRQPLNFGVVTSGIGANVFPVFQGNTGANGDAATVAVPVPSVGQPVTVYSQGFVDDRQGPTGRVLASNVIAIEIVP